MTKIQFVCVCIQFVYVVRCDQTGLWRIDFTRLSCGFFCFWRFILPAPDKVIRVSPAESLCGHLHSLTRSSRTRGLWFCTHDCIGGQSLHIDWHAVTTRLTTRPRRHWWGRFASIGSLLFDFPDDYLADKGGARPVSQHRTREYGKCR